MIIYMDIKIFSFINVYTVEQHHQLKVLLIYRLYQFVFHINEFEVNFFEKLKSTINYFIP